MIRTWLDSNSHVGRPYSGSTRRSQLTCLLGLTSIFYIAFLVSEAPGNYILQRVSVGPTIAVCMFIWGEYELRLTLMAARGTPLTNLFYQRHPRVLYRSYQKLCWPSGLAFFPGSGRVYDLSGPHLYHKYILHHAGARSPRHHLGYSERWDGCFDQL